MVSRLMCAGHMPTLDEMESFLVCRTLEYPASTEQRQANEYPDMRILRLAGGSTALTCPSTSELLGRNPTPMRSLLDRFRREDPLGP